MTHFPVIGMGNVGIPCAVLPTSAHDAGPVGADLMRVFDLEVQGRTWLV